MKYIFSLFTFFICTNLFAQKEANNWYFGEGAGITFNADGSTTNLNNSKLNTVEGCTTISDQNGELLFYTDGITVWNKNHLPMPNANAALGLGLLGDPSSTQSAIIVPKPDDPNIYYIFTVDTSSFENDPDTGFNYSTIDLRLDGGLGDVTVTEKNINLLNDSSEKISAVLKDCASKSIWVITFASQSGNPREYFDTFYAYEISSTGINITPVKSTFNIQIGDPRGYLKLSPDGTKLACANSVSGLYLFDFNPNTGEVNNPQEIKINFSPIDKPQSSYGVEFSQNSELLYVSTYYSTPRLDLDPQNQYGALLQYNLTSLDISSSEIVLDQKQMYRGALQLGPNGKIYRAMTTTYNVGNPFLSTINYPNKVGLDCNYQENSVPLNNVSTQGLPPFITSFFSEKINITTKESNFTYLPLCINETYVLKAENIPGAIYSWSKNDVPLAQPIPNHQLEIKDPGLYKVLIQSTTGNCADLLEGEALAAYFPSPVSNFVGDLKVCDDNNDGKSIFNFVNQKNQILGAQDPNIYDVKFFVSQEDADNNQNEILGYWENTENPQRIYTRIGIIENQTCVDTNTSFLIEVFNTPLVNNLSSFTICDNEPIDLNTSLGVAEIDLHQFDKELLDTQNASEFTVTYYNKISDAQNKENGLNYNYKLNVPVTSTLFARIENSLNENCYVISNPFDLIINALPTFSNSTLLQCDEDGTNDGKTTFNLLQAEEELTNNENNRSIKFFKLYDAITNTFSDEIINTENFVNDSNPQSLFVQIINDNTQCSSVGSLILEVSTTKIEDYEAIPLCDEIESEDGINSFNLDDITLNIQTLNSINHPINYYESYEDALSEKNVITSPYSNTTKYEQVIYARAENNNNCYGIAKVKLKINKLPNIVTTPTNPSFYCLNKFPETISINAALINDSPLSYTYNWSNGQTTYSININKTGTYTVDVTNKQTGCSKRQTIIVEASDIATFDVVPYKIIDASSNNSISVFTSGIGLYQYALYDENNLKIYRDFQDSNTFENVYPGIYNIHVKDIKNNCGVIDNKVFVIGFPKVVTPNNDGINDTWQLYGIKDNMLQANSKILIFDRYGKLIKELSPKDDGWNGLFKGIKLPSDDYWFAVTLQDGRIFKNHFTLKN